MTKAPGRSAEGIFITYRRADAAFAAGWLYDRLAARFGAGRVFKDVDSLDPGDDFAEVITAAVGSCAVLLAVIGGHWLAAADSDGRRRLDDPSDFVRLEIETALARGIRVIPVLVEPASALRPDQLPASLAGLARRQAVELSHARFSSDIGRLLAVLDNVLVPGGRAGAPTSWGALPGAVTLFQDDDSGFLSWREGNPDGFFLNAGRTPRSAYRMLHRAGCLHFTGSPLHWTRDYIKFCSPDRAALENWAASTTSGQVRHCRTCFG
jgi:hypothetical protein